MIKRVIFDIDDTLIPWKKEYDQEIRKALHDLKILYTDKDLDKISKAFVEYENVYYIFNKNKMSEYINEYTKNNYPKELVYNIIKRWESCVPDKLDKETYMTLDYLKSKYQIVILSDWYAESQRVRLEKANILQYFVNIYSAEKTKRKPFKEAFIQAIGENKPEECVMIGDDFERDIKGALNAGFEAIYYNPKNKINKIENNNYSEIKKLEELIKIL